MGRLCRCCRRRRGHPKGHGKVKGHGKGHGKVKGHSKGQRHVRPCSPPPGQPPCPQMTSPLTSATPAYVIWPPPAIVTLGAPRVALLGEGRPQTRCF